MRRPLYALSLLLLSACMSVLPVLAPKVSQVEPGISSGFPFVSHFVTVNGSKMHYVDEGHGNPAVLFHGNPTSSYLWRNITPALSENNRVIAIDMIGMGQSDKPDIAYRFDDYAAFKDAALAELGLRDVTLVAHDWGGAIALDYAARHPSNVRGIALMEAVIRPMTHNDANFVERFMFGQLRDPVSGPRLSGDENYFIEKLMPMMTGRHLTDAEMAPYNAPYPTRETRLPVWRWPAEIPIDGTPADNAKRVGANYTWLRKSDVPVLLLAASPGAIIKTPFVAGLKSDIPRLDVRSIGPGLHYIQETSPRLIGAELANWISTN